MNRKRAEKPNAAPRLLARAPAPRKIWALLFATWILLLSGVVAPWGAPPGGLQATHLASLLSSKHERLNQLNAEIERLVGEEARLTGNRFTQQREIRRVLGYAAPDEIIFDFSDRNSL